MMAKNAVKKKIVMYNPQPSPSMPYDGPPLAILAAVALIEQKEFDIKIIDWHYANFRTLLEKECSNAMVLGITCMTGYQIKGMLEAAKLAKKLNPQIKVVVGGWHPTFEPEQTLRSKFIDFAYLNTDLNFSINYHLLSINFVWWHDP